MSTSEKITMLLDNQPIPDPTECFAVPGSSSIIDCVHPLTGKTVIYGKTLEDVQREEPHAIRMTIDAWCTEKAAKQDSQIVWHEITEDQYENWFECLPPAAYGEHSFLIGEPADHHAGTGRPRYQACRKVGEQYQASSRPMTKQEFSALS